MNDRGKLILFWLCIATIIALHIFVGRTRPEPSYDLITAEGLMCNIDHVGEEKSVRWTCTDPRGVTARRVYLPSGHIVSWHTYKERYHEE